VTMQSAGLSAYRMTERQAIRPGVSMDAFAEAKVFADAAIGSMIKHGIAATPENYALWYAGVNSGNPWL
jgi:hypothetical protein